MMGNSVNGYARQKRTLGAACEQVAKAVTSARDAANKAKWKLFFTGQKAAACTRASLAQADAGASTAEYAIVLIAATGFAGLLAGILKSGTVKSMLTDLVEKALTLR